MQCLVLMRSAKSTLPQERDRDGVNKVNLEGACSQSSCRPRRRKSALTPGEQLTVLPKFCTGLHEFWKRSTLYTKQWICVFDKNKRVFSQHVCCTG